MSGSGEDVDYGDMVVMGEGGGSRCAAGVRRRYVERGGVPSLDAAGPSAELLGRNLARAAAWALIQRSMSQSWWRSFLDLLGVRRPRLASPGPSRHGAAGAVSAARRRPEAEVSVACLPPGEVDLAEGAEYPPAARVALSAEERDEAAALGAACRAAFDVSKLEAHAFPMRASRIVAMLADDEFDLDQLVALTQRDPALSACVLRVANSAASGSLEQIEGLRDAVVRLGARTVAGIAVVLASRHVFDGGASASRGPLREAWNLLWLHSVSSAFAAGDLALERRTANLEHAFLGGMLHDLGKTFALRSLGDAAIVGRRGDELAMPVIASVLELLHVEFGTAAANAWKLPPHVVEACALHHAALAENNLDVRIVRLASGLAAIHLSPHFREGLEDDVRATALSLGMDRFALRATLTGVRGSVRQARAL